MFNGKNILITGGTGSFGKKMTEAIIKRYVPRKLIIYSRDELKQYEMSRIFSDAKYPFIRYFIGDVRDESRLSRALNAVDYIIHAAALKQVPACEYNPAEAIKTNVQGAENVINGAIYNKVKRVIALSTDKAASPINLYGATKLCSDKLFIAGNALSGTAGTIFSVVRYGNVLGSRGSVIPLFRNRKKTGILPITDEKMTRFSITLEQGVDFVLRSLENMHGGELFVPKIPSYRILDVAKAIAPEAKYEYIGIRPGEKLHELMITKDDSRNTIEFEDQLIIEPAFDWWDIKQAYKGKGKPCPEGFEYSSNNNNWWLTVDELRDLIAKHCPEG